MSTLVLRCAPFEEGTLCVSSDQMQDFKRWNVCLCEEFTVPHSSSDELDEQSKRRLYFVTAHLRMLAPSKTNCWTNIQIEEEAHGWHMHSLTTGPVTCLEECEVLAKLGWEHLEQLRTWMDWILKFEKDWKGFFPLHMSLRLSEKASVETEPSVRFLTRVMALEALISSHKVHGKEAIDQLAKLYLNHDLLLQYQSEFQPKLSGLVCDETLLKNICIARNKIAHGQWPQQAWLQRNISRSNGRSLCYADVLGEAAASLLSTLWRHILSKGLQETFSDKKKMHAHFRSL